MLGVNESVRATYFPTASITACSYNEKLLYEMAKAIANEAAANQVGMFLGSGVNIKPILYVEEILNIFQKIRFWQES